MIRRRSAAGAGVLGAALLIGVVLLDGGPVVSQPVVSGPAGSEPTAPRSAAGTLPLAGIRIALDPGHQLGNHNFPQQINKLVDAGGFRKACNTTGTATNGGYPEATFNFRLARTIQDRLRALGAQVVLTRTRNSESLWGPCIDVRGRFGAKVGADLEISLHADGAASWGRGFHVISPVSRSPWTTDIAVPSRRLARALRGGLDARGILRSNYLASGTALVLRSDLGTLNLSDVPIAMIEIGNMRNAADARLMRSVSGRSNYASGVVRGVRRYLGR